MALINQNSIIGVTSITSPSSSNVLTVHANDTTERLRVSETGLSFSGTNSSLDTSGNATFNGNVSIGGTLTYEDVTNIDSVGVITARNAVVISEDNAIHFRGTAADDADAILRASAGGGQLLINSRNDTIINIDSNNDSTDAHFAVAHGAATGVSTELFRVQEDGSVGIGTDDPTADLEVYNSNQAVMAVRGDKATLAVLGDDTNSGASETDARIILCSDGTIANAPAALTTSPLTNHGFEIALINDEPGSGLRFHDGTANKERLRITSSGKVGIGTDNPLNGLDILQGNGRTRVTSFGHIITQNHNHGNTNYWSFAPRDGGEFDIGYGTADGNGTVAADKITITTTGSVGIGTTNPGSKLAVHGSITESTDGVTYYPVVTQQDVGLDQNQIPLNQNLGGMAYMDTSNYEQVFEIPATDVTSYFKGDTEDIWIGMEGHAPSSVAWPSGSLNQIDVWEIDFQLTYPNLTSGRNDLWMLLYYHNGSTITTANSVEWNNWVLARTSYAGTNTGWNQIQSASGTNWGKIANYMDTKLFSGQIRYYRGGTNDFTGSNAGQRTGVMWQFNYTHGGIGSTLAFGSAHPTTPSPSQPLAGFKLNADPENAGTVDSNGNSQVFGGYIRQRGFRLQGNI